MDRRPTQVWFWLEWEVGNSSSQHPNNPVKNPSTYPHNEHRVVWPPSFIGNEPMESAKDSGQLEGWNQILDKVAAVVAELAQAK
jgi:hypothetical protein